MLGYPISTAADILSDQQLEARNFWQTIEQPGIAKPLRVPGAFAKFSGMECSIRLPAPALGQHNQEILCGELGFSAAELSQLRTARII